MTYYHWILMLSAEMYGQVMFSLEQLELTLKMNSCA